MGPHACTSSASERTRYGIGAAAAEGAAVARLAAAAGGQAAAPAGWLTADGDLAGHAVHIFTPARGHALARPVAVTDRTGLGQVLRQLKLSGMLATLEESEVAQGGESLDTFINWLLSGRIMASGRLSGHRGSVATFRVGGIWPSHSQSRLSSVSR